jgi:DNA-binding CsgD family transcriptional regulator
LRAQHRHARLVEASQRRIAELASKNLTNREIAQMLFDIDRTVEGHLPSVFGSSSSIREHSSEQR